MNNLDREIVGHAAQTAPVATISRRLRQWAIGFAAIVTIVFASSVAYADGGLRVRGYDGFSTLPDSPIEVKDSSGKVVSPTDAKTDNTGRYAQDLPAGDYTVEVRNAGGGKGVKTITVTDGVTPTRHARVEIGDKLAGSSSSAAAAPMKHEMTGGYLAGAFTQALNVSFQVTGDSDGNNGTPIEVSDRETSYGGGALVGIVNGMGWGAGLSVSNPNIDTRITGVDLDRLSLNASWVDISSDSAVGLFAYDQFYYDYFYLDDDDFDYYYGVSWVNQVSVYRLKAKFHFDQNGNITEATNNGHLTHLSTGLNVHVARGPATIFLQGTVGKALGGVSVGGDDAFNARYNVDVESKGLNYGLGIGFKFKFGGGF